MPDAFCRNLLVVEDDADARSNLADILELDDYDVETAGTSAEARRKLAERQFCAVIIDRQLPDGRADDLLPELKRSAPGTSFIVVTGYSDLDGAIAALRQGADDYILKPLNPDALRAGLRRLGEQRRLAYEKERSEAAFRHLVEAAECLIVLVDADARILYLSPFAERVAQSATSELAGRSFIDQCLELPCEEGFRRVLRRVCEGESIHGYETTFRTRTTSARSVIWNLRRLENTPAATSILLVGQDITDLKRANDMVLRGERLAAIGQMVTGLAHESRNALQRSQACLEMLSLEVKDRPAAIDLIGRIQAAQDDLARLYEDVRNFAAPILLDRKSCRLVQSWRRAWKHLEAPRAAKEGRLEERLHLDEEIPIFADPFRLEQVFRNIFDNALAAGRAPVLVRVSAGGAILDGTEAVEVRVQDDGPGLTSEQKSKIFETFYTTKTKGTGLGMSISKRIVEAHGGTVAVGDGKDLPGAEIIVTLPKGNV